uniref:Putative secreted protein n=1 Tax=Anopheles marajoara TaxID=58244 RepID=A0A2M4CB63_9DIPT
MALMALWLGLGCVITVWLQLWTSGPPPTSGGVSFRQKSGQRGPIEVGSHHGLSINLFGSQPVESTNATDDQHANTPVSILDCT